MEVIDDNTHPDDIHPTISSLEITLDGTILGIGKFGVVKKGRCRGHDVAVKVVISSSLVARNRFMTEIRVMSKIRAPNVCLLLGACIENGNVCIVQEYIPGGDLGFLLKQNKLPTTIHRRMLWALDVVRGMMWIHHSDIYHRDLKLENLLLDKHGEIKVCDFGLSDLCSGKTLIIGQEIKGTPLYSAPEVFLKQSISSKVDVYSFGLVLWELLAKQRVFAHHNNRKVFKESICIKKERPPNPPPKQPKQTEDPKYDSAWENPALVELLNNCWQHEPSNRPSFDEIYEQLNLIIFHGFIDDNYGRIFWHESFGREFEVPWTLFVSKLENVIIFNETFKKEVALECLKRALSQFDINIVTQESFGKLLSWFGPFIVNTNETFLHRMLDTCSCPWFHGNLAMVAANELLVKMPPDTNPFLVRYNTIPGFFTVQTLTSRFIVERENGLYKLQENLHSFPSLRSLVDNSILSKFPHVCPCSYFKINPVNGPSCIYTPFEI